MERTARYLDGAGTRVRPPCVSTAVGLKGAWLGAPGTRTPHRAVGAARAATAVLRIVERDFFDCSRSCTVVRVGMAAAGAPLASLLQLHSACFGVRCRLVGVQSSHARLDECLVRQTGWRPLSRLCAYCLALFFKFKLLWLLASSFLFQWHACVDQGHGAIFALFVLGRPRRLSHQTVGERARALSLRTPSTPPKFGVNPRL